MTVWAAASEAQYVAHLAPIWRALDPAIRGGFVCSTPAALTEAVRLGCEPQKRLVRRLRPGKIGAAALWMVASYGDLRHIAPGRTILVEHGAGQNYVGDAANPIAGASPHYSGGQQRGSVELFVCPNETVAARNREVYPHARQIVAGSPRLDDLGRIRAARGETRSAGPLTVAVSFHWDCRLVQEARWAWPHWRAAVERLASDPSIEILGHGHPRAWPHLARWWADLGVEPVPLFDDVVARADVYVVDNSSTLFEAAALDVPVVVLDAPWYRERIEHGLRFWKWADVGPRVRSGAVEDLHSAVEISVDSSWSEVRARMTADVYGGPLSGRSSAAAAAAIEEAAS